MKTGNAFAQHNSENQPGVINQGVSGSGEELAMTLEKVVSQLDIISRTLHVLEQRVSMNENSVNVCLQYFRDQRERSSHMPARAMMEHIEDPSSYRSDINQLKAMTHTIKNGVEKLQSHVPSVHSSQAYQLRDDMEGDDQGQDLDHELDDFKRDQ